MRRATARANDSTCSPFLGSVESGAQLWRRLLTIACVSAVLLATWSIALIGLPSALACQFCTLSGGKTLTERVDEADYVVHGTWSNPKLMPDAAPGQPDATTELNVLTVLKSHPSIAGKTMLVLPVYIPETESGEYLIFAEVVDGKADPYHRVPVDSRVPIEYLAGWTKIEKSKGHSQLGYFFHFLGNSDATVSGDAYKHFANAPYSQVAQAAGGYDRTRILAWLRDKRTPSYRIGLYGCLLGTCGQASDAAVLHDLVSHPASRPFSGSDGLMGGYCLLEPQRGTDYVLGVLANPREDFNFRYNALRAIRFVLAEMTRVDKAAILEGMTAALVIDDMADLVMDDLRKSGYWAPLPQILARFATTGPDDRAIRQAIVRFALQCPEPAAKTFIADLRKTDPVFVADVEELLRYEDAQKKRDEGETKVEGGKQKDEGGRMKDE